MKPLFLSVLTAAFGMASQAAADIVLINVFEVPQGEREAVIAAWEDARDFLAEQPGYIATELHGAITPDARFELINIARWESPETFMAATQAMRAAGVFTPPANTLANPALYTVLRAD